ncbi:MAG: RsmD family RNA methyltransferase, partial [Planctomycetota bacterium]|nr:RsmD family RNA methyltransferase [Planctomycetota bacterium]
MNDQANQPVPPQVSDFDLIRVIGEGGFGQVWLAKSQTTGRLRAVKVIPLRGDGGTGALGLEAISRGAVAATITEQHYPTAKILRENIATLEIEP